MGEETGCRRIGERTSGHFPPPRRTHPARLHQHVQRALGDLDTPYRLDFGAADGFVIGDDGKRLDCRPAEPPCLVPLAPEDVRKIGRGLEMPALAALDELDAAPRIMVLQRLQRLAYVDMHADI